MQKLLLLSLLISTLVIPVRLLKGSAEGDEYKATLKVVAPVVAGYILLLLFVYPRLF